jgi:hypothetical protein
MPPTSFLNTASDVQQEIFMARRKIKRKRGEGIAISGPATVRVTRGVTLVVDAARHAHVARLKKLAAAVPIAKSPEPGRETGGESAETLK